MTAFALDDPRWRRHLVLAGGWRIFVRPIMPDDEHLFRDLLAHVSKEDLRLRFFDSIKEFSHQFIAGLTHLDYARAMAFVAIDEDGSDILGVVRLHLDKSPRDRRIRHPAAIGSQGQGPGLGHYATDDRIRKSEGLRRIDGQILQETSVMLKMCRELGFKVKTDAKDRGVCDVTLVLDGH